MARQKFVNSPYIPDIEGHLHPQLPESCPRDRSGVGCEIVIVSYRKRVHGPGFPFAIAFCQKHRRFFTLYPPGWFPYGRLPLVPVGSLGTPVLEDDGRTPWKITIFRALVDAALGNQWPEERNRGACDEVIGALGCARTQKRHLELSLRILGISKETYRRGREEAAAHLGVDLSLVNEAWRRSRVRSRDGPCQQLRGTEGGKILDAIVLSQRVTSNMLRRWQRESQSSTPPSGTRIGCSPTSL